MDHENDRTPVTVEVLDPTEDRVHGAPVECRDPSLRGFDVAPVMLENVHRGTSSSSLGHHAPTIAFDGQLSHRIEPISAALTPSMKMNQGVK